MPNNYYTNDGNLSGGAPGAPAADGNPNQAAQPAQAEVVQKNPPPATPFFASEESDEHGGQEPLVARR
jgi:hypothetical protein